MPRPEPRRPATPPDLVRRWRVPARYWPIRLALLALAAALTSIALLAPPASVRATSGASCPLGDIDRGYGPVLVPCTLPPWLDGDPLAAIARQLEIGDGAAGRELLLRLLRERGGALILPSEADAANLADPPWKVLAEWAASLPAPSRERLRLDPALAEREAGAGEVDAGSPLLWLEGLEELALRRLEEAVEAGDRDTASLLLRRPGLAERVHPAPRAWIARSGPELPVPDPDPPLALHTLARVPLDLEPNPLDSLDRRPLPSLRRVPLADIHPALLGDLAVLPGRPGPFLVELGGAHRRLSVLPPPYPGEDATHGPLRDAAWFAVHADGSLALPARTPKREYVSMVDWMHDPSPWRDRGWTEPGIFDVSGDPASPRTLAAARLAEEGFTIGGAPLIDNDVVYWLATRGVNEVETWLLAHSRADGSERWRALLGTVTPPWLSGSDLRGLFPEGRIVPHRDELFAIHGGGWIARVGRARGDLRGALLYPRNIETPKGTPAKWDMLHLAHLPAPRPRYLGDAWIDESGGRARLIALPPDAREVLAIDIEEWRIAWAHRTSEPSLLRRDAAGIPWVIDLYTSPGRRTLEVTSLEAATGRLRAPSVKLELPGGDPSRRLRGPGVEHEEEDYSPLLAGIPSLAGDWIAVPIREGWALWPREPLAGGAPQRIIPWPEGCPGGTMVPAGRDRWLAIHRAEPTWGTRSSVEILGATAAAPPPEGR